MEKEKIIFNEQQKLARNLTGNNILVSASAGSGKTQVLISRLIQRIDDCLENKRNPVDSLIVLTFTNKASEEMKKRLKKEINKIINNPFENEFVETGRLKHYRRYKEEVLPYIDSMQVGTFDAYSANFVRKYSNNIHSDFQILEPLIMQNIKIKTIRNILERKYHEPYSKDFEEFLSIFNEKNDLQLEKEILSLATKIESLLDKEAYLENYLDNFYSIRYINNTCEQYQEIVRKALNNIANALDTFNKREPEAYLNALKSKKFQLYKELTVTSVCNLKDYIELINKNYDSKSIEEEYREIAKQYHELIKKYMATIKEYLVIDFKKEAEHYDNSKDKIKILIEIISDYLNDLKKFKYTNQCFEFQDISLEMLSILSEREDVAKEIREQTMEIMVDEFQDTNDIQDFFLDMLKSNNIYMVGDEKQAIYRFRNADLKIFLAKQNKFETVKNENDNSKICEGFKVRLDSNYRSQENVIKTVNQIFKDHMDNYVDMVADRKRDYEPLPSSFITIIDTLELKTNGQDISKVYELSKYIKEQRENGFLKGCHYKDIAILVAKTDLFPKIQTIFAHADLPIDIQHDNKIINKVIFNIYKSIFILIDYLFENKEIDVEFKLAFLSVARSFLYEEPDINLHNYIKNNTLKEHKMFKTLYKIVNDLSKLTNVQIIERILDDFNILNLSLKYEEYQNIIIGINKLYDIAQGLTTIKAFGTSFIKNMSDLLLSDIDVTIPYINDKSIDAIKILTFFGSKGLEFKYVFVLDVEDKFFVKRNDVVQFNKAFGFMFAYPEKDNTSIFKEKRKTLNQIVYQFIEKEETIKEKLRVFYVASTRAKEKTIFWAITKIKKENSEINSFFDLLNTITFKDNLEPKYLNNSWNKNYDILYSPEAEPLPLDYNVPIKSTSDYIPNLLINESKQASKSLNKLINKTTYSNLSLGTQLHEILQFIDFNSPNYDNVPLPLKPIIKQFLTSPLLLNKATAQIIKEYPFKYDNTSGIIDLLMIYPDHIDIIDYKTKNIADKDYDLQLKIYSDFIKTKSTLPIRLYLYSLMTGEEREIII
ncbi:MAG: UvrD-helicase domain-containing protein [Bacillales bacterium]|jgi:ATP-dependent helicase/nuclease subunit A|nr:UvrD-helicase domain-containing protein [Bacillales bacterium]